MYLVHAKQTEIVSASKLIKHTLHITVAFKNVLTSTLKIQSYMMM